jgi:hypothetical protein
MNLAIFVELMVKENDTVNVIILIIVVIFLVFHLSMKYINGEEIKIWTKAGWMTL